MPVVTDSFERANEKQEVNVFVLPPEEKLSYQDLLELLQRRRSPDDPKILDDVTALSKTKIDKNILNQVSVALATTNGIAFKVRSTNNDDEYFRLQIPLASTTGAASTEKLSNRTIASAAMAWADGFYNASEIRFWSEF